MEIVNEIRSNGKSSVTKREKIVQAVSHCISDNVLSIGDTLPSVNELSNELGYSRETVVKAYAELKNRGIVDSKHGVGYFVVNTRVNLKQNIALVLYGFQTFQQEFYDAFRQNLGEKYKIDVYFHHNNFQMYESIINNIRGQYSSYIIAPIQSSESEQLLQLLPHERLLIIDRYIYLESDVAKITQEFELSLLNVFEQLRDKIDKYNKIVVFYHEESDYPQEIFTAVKSFCNSNQYPLEVHKSFKSDLLENGSLFFTIGDKDLWQILKYAKKAGMSIGQDFGVLSHNDSPVKEIIEGGISTFSTDFRLMGEEAANYIMNKSIINKIIPSKLIERNSM